jgi:hypothetical protein
MEVLFELLSFSPVPVVHAARNEKLWREFFSDPSQWWDHRSEKVNDDDFCHNPLVDGRNQYSLIVMIAWIA